MTLTLELTTDETARLKSAAQQTGSQIGDVVHKLISELPEPVTKLTAGAQALAEWEAEGILGLWSDRADSPELARELRQQGQTRDHSE
jgi:hypothetical protein